MVRGDGASGPALAWICAALQVGWRWASATRGCFLGGRQPIGGALRPRAVIRQGTLEGRERAVAPFI